MSRHICPQSTIRWDRRPIWLRGSWVPQAICRSASSSLSHFSIRFQLANVWLTSLRPQAINNLRHQSNDPTPDIEPAAGKAVPLWGGIAARVARVLQCRHDEQAAVTN